MAQMQFDLESLGLSLVPTIAMRRGEQEVYQHAHCGTVVVRSSLAHESETLGACPSCTNPAAAWWRQSINEDGLAGLHLIAVGGRDSRPGSDS
jgi:hypothetical protein